MGAATVDLSDLRWRYSGRQRHSLLLALLGALLGLGVAFLLLVLVFYPHDFDRASYHFTLLSVCVCLVLVLLVSLALLPAETFVSRWSICPGLVVWALLMAPTALWATSPFASIGHVLPPAFVAAFLLHTVLPLWSPVAVALGLLSSGALLVGLVVVRRDDAPRFECQMAASGLFLLTATAVGWYHRHMRDAAQERSFDSTRQCIEARIKLEYEKEQQEQLLLSVIPAYIAAEVKRSIMLKMADACQSSTKRSRQRFHELYVQRHNNVR